MRSRSLSSTILGVACFAALAANAANAQGIPIKTSFFGGNSGDRVQGVTVDAQGRVYMVGNTASTNYGQVLPLALGGYDKVKTTSDLDGFVAIFTRDLSQVLAWTYIGGSGEDRGYGVAVDASGRPTIVGFTTSTDFPSTTGSTSAGTRDVFVARFSADLKQLQMSTVVGGAGEENCRDSITLDANGNIFISGLTDSYDFPTTTGVFQKNHSVNATDNWDAFVAKLLPTGHIAWATYLGGNGNDAAYSGVRVRPDGTVYVAGMTNSSNLPTTPGVFQPNFGGWNGVDPFIGDGFVARFSADGKQLLFCTYLGGPQNDMVAGNDAFELDSQGNPVLIGMTYSPTFPTTPGAYDRVYSGGAEPDGCVVKLSADGRTLLASTFLGGSDFEEPSGLGLDADDNIYMSGNTRSTDYPVTPDARQSTYSGGIGDGMLTKLSSDLTQVMYSTYIGGNGLSAGNGHGDRGRCLAFNIFNEVVVSGDTDSPNFPATPQACLPTYQGGSSDGFVSMLRLTDTYAFGTGKRNSLGLEPFLTWTGIPSAAAGSFTIRMRNVVPGTMGRLVHGADLVDLPFKGGSLYVERPLTTDAWTQATAFGQSTFVIPVDLSLVGTVRVYQYFYRDDQVADGTGVGLTNALKATFLP